MKQADADRVSKFVIAPPADIDLNDSREKEALLGCVIWVLSAGLRIKGDVLAKALEYANFLHKDSYSLECWVDKETRIQTLNEEIKMIERAQKNSGCGSVRHIPGLLEQMGAKLG